MNLHPAAIWHSADEAYMYVELTLTLTLLNGHFSDSDGGADGTALES